MRVKAWQTLRAGFFLLFAVLLVVLGPVQDGAAGTLRAAPAETKSDHLEHRDGETLRERLNGIAGQRRTEDDRRGSPLPAGMQPAAESAPRPPGGQVSSRGGKPPDDRAHRSPAALQVFRH